MVGLTHYPEPIRILSDLHLGHPGSRIQAAEDLRPLLEGARTVIFNGDTREMLATNYVAKGERLYGDLLKLIAELEIEAHFMRGNHDPDISDIHHIDLCGTEVLVTHGDVLFPEISPWGVSTKKELEEILAHAKKFEEEEGDDFEARLRQANQVCKFTHVFDRDAKPGLLGHLFTLHDVLWPPRKPLALLRVWMCTHRLAAEFCSKYRPEAKVMLFGHSHLPGVWDIDGRTYVNTGGFISLGGAQIVEVSGDELRVFVVKRKGNSCTMAEKPRRIVRVNSLEVASRQL